LEPAYLREAAAVTRDLHLADPMPPLCALVVASPFDAAIHDAYGKALGLNCYHTYGSEFVNHDLGHYLGAEFKGEYLDRSILADPKPRMPLYHLVGALDAITDADVKQRLGDGMPETLPEWIAFNGLTHIKVKLNGDDRDWDVQRFVSIERAAAQAQKQR